MSAVRLSESMLLSRLSSLRRRRITRESAWGPGIPILLYAGEQTAYMSYWKNLPEAASRAWGDLAIASGADGYLDGGTVTVPRRR
jgi:hypothetical protein